MENGEGGAAWAADVGGTRQLEEEASLGAADLCSLAALLWAHAGRQ